MGRVQIVMIFVTLIAIFLIFEKSVNMLLSLALGTTVDINLIEWFISLVRGLINIGTLFGKLILSPFGVPVGVVTIADVGITFTDFLGAIINLIIDSLEPWFVLAGIGVTSLLTNAIVNLFFPPVTEEEKKEISQRILSRRGG